MDCPLTGSEGTGQPWIAVPQFRRSGSHDLVDDARSGRRFMKLNPKAEWGAAWAKSYPRQCRQDYTPRCEPKMNTLRTKSGSSAAVLICWRDLNERQVLGGDGRIRNGDNEVVGRTSAFSVSVSGPDGQQAAPFQKSRLGKIRSSQRQREVTGFGLQARTFPRAPRKSVLS